MSGRLATLAAAILITIFSNVKAYAVDLTGYWKANDQGTYYMRQIGSVLWWYGSLVDSSTHATVFSNVARGTISGKQIKLTWADVPPGPNRNNGILVLKIVKRLLDTGISLHNIRVAVDHLRQRGVQDLANITLFSDGTTVYECTSAEEVVDLLQGGQGVFGIAVSGAMRELTGAIADFPGERADGGESIAAPEDELASRRKHRDRKIG